MIFNERRSSAANISKLILFLDSKVENDNHEVRRERVHGRERECMGARNERGCMGARESARERGLREIMHGGERHEQLRL